LRIKEEISQVINAANKVNVSGVKDDANVINKKLQPKKHTRNWGNYKEKNLMTLQRTKHSK